MLSALCVQGQDLRIIEGLGSGGTGVRFLTKIKSIGNYNILGKSYFIDYSNVIDTSTISSHATFLQKSLSIQGANRIYERHHADFIVNISFSSDKDGNTIYRELKYHSFYGSKTKDEWDIYSSDANRSSRTNPGNPYYKSSAGEAGSGKRTSSHRISAPSYSFSTIIDGVSQTGELLWSTIVTDSRSAAVSNSIFPYLCFAAIGRFGSNIKESIQFISNNPLYEQCNKGMLSIDNTVLFPDFTSSSKKVDVCCIIKGKDKTIVVLRYGMNQKFFKQSKVILKNGDEKIPASDFYAEQWLPNNSYKSFLFIEFPVKSSNLKELFLIFYNKKNEKEILSLVINNQTKTT